MYFILSAAIVASHTFLCVVITIIQFGVFSNFPSDFFDLGYLKVCCFISEHLNMSHVSCFRVSSLIPLWLLNLHVRSQLQIYLDSLYGSIVSSFLGELCAHKEKLYPTVMVLGIEPRLCMCWAGALPLSYTSSL